MKIKGADKFLEKVPWFSGRKIILLPLYIITTISLSFLILFYFDALPQILSDQGNLEPIIVLFPILGVLILDFTGLVFVYQVWLHRERLKKKYGELAYQRIFLIGLAGVFMIIIVAIHNIVSSLFWQTSLWSLTPYSFFSNPLSIYITGGEGIFLWIRVIGGLLVLVLGFFTFFRSFFTFGMDYMTVVYLYFPEESELQEHRIYSILRHPAYASAIYMGLGGMIFQLNLYSIISFIIIYLVLYIHIHYIEEKELIERFGDSFKNYRENTRAFFIKFKDLGKFFGFLFGRD